MRYIGIIPARYASTRFPGKPLTLIHGKTMIQHVYENSLRSTKLSNVIIATDDERIKIAAEKFGATCAMTSPNHLSGTDRCFEAAQQLNCTQDDIILNIQGDEPYIDPEQIDLLCSCFENESTNIATLVKKINTYDELNNTNTPKVVLDINKRALLFSRTAIPYTRGIDESKRLAHTTFYKHIGLYAFRYETLKKITALKPSPLEITEGLEQLRWIENGYTIQTAITTIETIAIDVPEDLRKLK